jgi:Na+/H+-dicarboxylate symporter
MLKKALALGVVAGILAGVVSLIYAYVYKNTQGVEFDKVAPTVNIITSSLAGGILAALGFWLADKFFKKNGEIVFNFVLMILTFASLMGPISYRLPLDIEGPELFPGYAVPMHFFPALAWFTLKPLFFRNARPATV